MHRYQLNAALLSALLALPTTANAQPVVQEACYLNECRWDSVAQMFEDFQNPVDRQTLVTGTVVGVGKLRDNGAGVMIGRVAIFITGSVARPVGGYGPGQIKMADVMLMKDYDGIGTTTHPQAKNGLLWIVPKGAKPTDGEFREAYLGKDFVFGLAYWTAPRLFASVWALSEKNWIRACVDMDREACARGPF